jgi:hypothetical protein
VEVICLLVIFELPMLDLAQLIGDCSTYPFFQTR